MGLFVTDGISEADKITDTESICIEADGNIYGSGSKKSTQFPSVIRGTKVRCADMNIV